MLGQRLDDRQQKQAIREADPLNTGELEFEQFAVYASRYVEVEEDVDAVAKELREAFLLYDRDGTWKYVYSNIKLPTAIYGFKRFQKPLEISQPKDTLRLKYCATFCMNWTIKSRRVT